MKKLLVTLLVLVLIFGTAVVSCPDKTAHEEALKNFVRDTVNDSLAGTDDDELTPVLSYFAVGLSGLVFQGLLSVDNYSVCSVGRLNYDGKDEVVTFGVFNHVFIVPNEELRQKLEQDFE